jgi:hypothetical protein
VGGIDSHGRETGRLIAAFPSALAEIAGSAIRTLPAPPTLATTVRDPIEALVDGDRVLIPYRMYYAEPSADAMGALSEAGRMVIGCLYTRDHDGRVRQRAVQDLVSSTQACVVPFVVQLIGEYVIEIIDVIWAALDDVSAPDSPHRGQYQRFVQENQALINLTTARVASYWNCYYRRRFPDRFDYAGYRLLRGLNALS